MLGCAWAATSHEVEHHHDGVKGMVARLDARAPDKGRQRGGSGGGIRVGAIDRLGDHDMHRK